MAPVHFVTVTFIHQIIDLFCVLGDITGNGVAINLIEFDNIVCFQVEKTDKAVEKIKTTTKENRQKYKLLSLVSMAKMRKLFMQLHNCSLNSNSGIIEDIGLLLECDQFCRFSEIEVLESRLEVT